MNFLWRYLLIVDMLNLFFHLCTSTFTLYVCLNSSKLCFMELPVLHFKPKMGVGVVVYFVCFWRFLWVLYLLILIRCWNPKELCTPWLWRALMLSFILNSLLSHIFLCHAPGQDPYTFLNFEIFDIRIKRNSLRLHLFLFISLFLP